MKNIVYLFVCFLVGCSSKNPIEKALNSSNSKIKKVVVNLNSHEVQILFTEVIEENGKVFFNDFSFQVNDDNYFYPASSVKFPIALLALEKLNKNKLLNINTKFRVENDTLITSFKDEINKLFAVSDNLAYTRLFEYLGQNYIKNQLRKRGIKSRISHRFSVPKPYSLETKELYFYENDSIIYTANRNSSDSLKSLNLNRVIKGKGYIKNDTLINKPMDFSLKNYLPLSSLHNLMKQLMFPSAFEKEKRFQLSKTNRDFILKSMSNLPFEVGYDRKEYYDSYVKFFMFGDSKKTIPKSIKIYNKVGYAYGYLTDCAYIINKTSGKKYIITATIHVNNNKVFNDNKYEYETIGIPFLAELGRQLVLNN